MPTEILHKSSTPGLKTVVTILSTNFAGSHFLSSMLGSHSRAVHLGEALHLRKLTTTGQVVCSRCARENRECPLFRGVRPETIHRVYDLAFSNCPPETELLVDNSKYVRWARRFVGRPGMKYVHLIRDPRALVRRWWYLPGITLNKRIRLRYRTARRFPRYALGALFGPLPALSKWLGLNEGITDFLRRYSLDHRVLTYRDMALNPERVVRGLQDWLGHPFEPPQLEYWNHQLHGTQKPEYEGKQEQFFDTRWKADLPQEIQARIVGDPRVHRYLGTLGIRVVEDGLTKEA
jgi:hypothetical protein